MPLSPAKEEETVADAYIYIYIKGVLLIDRSRVPLSSGTFLNYDLPSPPPSPRQVRRGPRRDGRERTVEAAESRASNYECATEGTSGRRAGKKRETWVYSFCDGKRRKILTSKRFEQTMHMPHQQAGEGRRRDQL